MTGFESKRQMSRDKLDDDDDAQAIAYTYVYADTLLVAYQQGFADGKRSAQRKPLTTSEIDLLAGKNQNNDGTVSYLLFARAIEVAHNIGDKT